MDWALPDGSVSPGIARVQPYFLGQKTAAFRHAMARRPGDRYYGARRQDRPARSSRPSPAAARCATALGYDPQRGDPLYKNWPFLHRQGRAERRLATDSSTTTAPRALRSRLRARQLFRPLSLLRGRGRRPRLLSLPRPAAARRHAEIPRPDRPHRAAAALVARLRADRDGAGRRARRAGADRGRDRQRRAEHEIPLSAFHFGSGYTSIGAQALRLHLEPRQVSRPEGADARLRGGGHQGRRQRQALPARRSSALCRSRRARRLRRRRGRSPRR